MEFTHENLQNADRSTFQVRALDRGDPMKSSDDMKLWSKTCTRSESNSCACAAFHLRSVSFHSGFRLRPLHAFRVEGEEEGEVEGGGAPW